MKPWSQLEQAGQLAAADVEIAEGLGRVCQESDPEVLLTLALVSREVQAGNVCLDLERWADRELTDPAQAPLWRLPRAADWRAKLARSPLVNVGGPEGEPKPLVLDADGRLYFTRYYEHELALARRVRALGTGSPASSAPPAGTEPASELLERLFPPLPAGQPDQQRAAVVAARQRQLSLIVGGPGTGKTSTVVKLLAVLVADRLAQQRTLPRILLTAPTGKAAQRLAESIERARDQLPVEPRIKAAIPSTASTIHRALGPVASSSTRFRHHRDNPLACDIFLLDEASMVDLALMRRLLDAIPEHARIIMLGDPDQLVSVEAGGVLGDLCTSASDPASPLASALSRLTHSYRYPKDSGIAALANAVHAQDARTVLDVLRSSLPDVSYGPAVTRATLTRSLEAEAKRNYRPLHEPELERKLSALDAYRVLCAHRRGHGGVEELNLALARLVSGRLRRPEDNYAGRPIMITHNEYTTRLFNGDVGVLHKLERAGLSAHFRVGPQNVRNLSLARLPRHESVYAMTVHKSQGSEFDAVAIVLPERPSPILSRELLYTAITRAKQTVSIHASEAALKAAVGQRSERASGLVERLRD
ncbi:MAG: exodeoxyribonuclease V subunit alpha [Myxococcales bacterium]